MKRQMNISDLERFTPIKAHTIRTWETRYQLLAPQRTDTAYRQYTLEEAALFFDIALLNEQGMKISKISSLGIPGIREKAAAVEGDLVFTRIVYQLIHCMYAVDVMKFENILQSAVLTYGYERTMYNVIMPFLEKTRMYHYIDGHISTHFSVTAVRKKIIGAIEKLATVSNGQTVLMFLPKGEHFDLILLFMNWLLKKHGCAVLYLGTNVSLNDLSEAVTVKKPDWVCTYFSKPFAFNEKEYRDVVKTTSLLIGIPEPDNIAVQNKVQYVYYRDVVRCISSVKA